MYLRPQSDCKINKICKTLIKSHEVMGGENAEIVRKGIKTKIDQHYIA